MAINRQKARCENCWWWESEDQRGETCKGTYNTDPDYHCHEYRAEDDVARCGECRWLDEPLRNRTCRFHYDRDEDSPICDPPLSKTRRYTRNPSLTEHWTTYPHLRDRVTGKPLDVLISDPEKASVLVLAPEVYDFGLLVSVTPNGGMRAQPVQIRDGRVVLTETGARVEQMAFAGHTFAIDASGDTHLYTGQISSLLVEFADVSQVWQQAEDRKVVRKGSLAEDLVQVDEPNDIIPHDKAYVLGPAKDAVARIVLGGKKTIEEAAESVARRFARSHQLSEPQRKSLAEKLVSAFK